MTLDPNNKTQVRKLINRAESKFKLSAKAWEIGNNSGSNASLAAQSKRKRRLAREGEALLKPLGIKCDWSGLYPSFTVKGYAEYSTESAVLVALGHERKWLRDKSE